MEYGDPKLIKLIEEPNSKVEFRSAVVTPIAFISWMFRVIPIRLFNLDYFSEVWNSFSSFAQVEL